MENLQRKYGKNLHINKTEKAMYLEPYDRTITTRYAKQFIKDLKKTKLDDIYSVCINDHVVSGLYETNTLIIKTDDTVIPIW